MKIFNKYFKQLVVILLFIFLILIGLIFTSEDKTYMETRHKKVVVIGDSRMELIDNGKDYSKQIPNNITFIAKSGMKNEWFNDFVLMRLTDLLKNPEYKYDVIINLGVNDICFGDETKSISEYTNSIRLLAKLFNNTNFYVLSVNPVNENLIFDYFDVNPLPNKKIQMYNTKLINFIKKEKLQNLNYCNAFDKIKYTTKDGLHYTEQTNEKIISYILNDCIKKH